MLVCGYNLDGNPPAISVAWTDPNHQLVENDTRLQPRLDTNAGKVWLYFSTTVPEDAGVWTCQLVVSARNETHSVPLVTVYPIKLFVVGKLLLQSNLSVE